LKLRIENLQRELPLLLGRSLLDAALAGGLNLPHSCKGGNCGSCAARLVSGEYHYPNGVPLGLTDAQRAEGLLLLCQARAQADIAVEIQTIARADEILIKRLPARIERCERVAHDVLRLQLRLPLAESFEFQAGQYIDVLLPGGRRRSFSIASAPQGHRLLELHVRHVPGGAFTEALFAEAGQKRLLNIEGPLGRFVYRASPAPMLLIAGGTGLAPLSSIIRHVLQAGEHRRMRLFWGCRAQRDLYEDAQLRDWLRDGVLDAYVPVLSEPDPDWRGERGWVHEAALRVVQDLPEHDVYAAGPPAMIAAVRQEFGARGAQRLYFDSFDYAPDSLERQRSSAARTS
jgi:CDP-4-dehydro-6-deoxyglucose reductase, E3